MKKFILDLLFPIHCIRCGKEGKFICVQCLEQIPLNKKRVKSIRRSGLNKIVAVADYKNNLIKNAIHRYKYDFAKELSKPLGALMAKKLLILGAVPNGLVLIPVPLHKKRLRWRGFNQSELLCREIAKILDVTVIDNILARVKNTPPQVKIENFSKREANIQNAFVLTLLQRVDLWKNKTIILVDDIATTGATLQQCAKALKPLRPKSIHALVLAR